VREPSDYSTEFADRLRALGVEPVLIGALAANVYRLTPRSTTDVDILVSSLTNVAEAMEAAGFEVKVMAEAGEPYAMFVRGDGIRVDLLAAQTEYQRLAIARAVDGVLTAEDIVVHKLIAWRTRDRDDVQQILAAGHSLDRGYIAGWAEAWGVADRWEEALRGQ
jgi:hypothetical protein